MGTLVDIWCKLQDQESVLGEPEMALQSATGFMLQDLMRHWNKKGFVSTDTSCLAATKPFWTVLVWVGCSQNISHFFCCCFLSVDWLFFFFFKWFEIFLLPFFLNSNSRKISLEVLLCSICSSPLWSLHWPWKVILCLYFQLWHCHCMGLQQCTSSLYWPKSNSTFFSIMPHNFT